MDHMLSRLLSLAESHPAIALAVCMGVALLLMLLAILLLASTLLTVAVDRIVSRLTRLRRNEKRSSRRPQWNRPLKRLAAAFGWRRE